MTAYADVMPTLRTSLARPDSQVILSYYQSSLADQPYMGDQEIEQVDELNPSDLSPLSHTKDDDLGSTTKQRGKHNNNMTNTENNRRIAIVPLEIETHEEERSSAPGIATTTLPSSSRELVVEVQLEASALVAPPDSTLGPLHDIPFSSLTSSLPSIVSPTNPSVVRSPSSSAQADPSRKARTTSHTKSSSRDIGIVGTRRESPRVLARPAQDTLSDLKPPIFQTPTTRSPSPRISVSADSDSPAQHILSNVSHAPPAAMSASVESMHSVPSVMNGLTGYSQRSAASLIAPSSRQQGISTSEQGQVSPSTMTTMPAPPSSYLYYQPGLHSKAGPLPPPPRAMFDMDFSAPPPPRPPRFRSPSPLTSKGGSGELSTPASVTLTLASKASVTSIQHQIQLTSTPTASSESSSTDGSVYSPEPEPVPTSTDVAIHHTREGAFPPSTILVAPAERQQPLSDNTVRLVADLSSKDQLPDLPTDSPDETPPVITQPADDDRDPTTARPSQLRREPSWVSSSNDSARVSSESGRRAFEDVRPGHVNGSPPSIREIAPEDDPPSSQRRGVLTNLKRYSSLPRTPSARSPRSPRMSIFARSWSPESLPRPRIRARSPDAMQFKDVLAKKTSLERAIGYANKINELSMYDCGLGDWVTFNKERGNSRTRLVPIVAEHPSDRLLVPRARHTSRASISSEMTFPLRADAYIATDLSLRDTDSLPSPNVPPPALPYPALAGVQPAINYRHSTMIGSPLSYTAPAGSKATGGFFASLGRVSSTRKDSIHLNGHKPSLSSHARLTKQPPATTAPNPRPVQLVNAPSVPGGPRALPNRIQRSRTLMLSPSPPSSESTSPSPPMRRRSNTLKRPSFFGRSPGPSPDNDNAAAGTEFTRQVEKLAELLPHADKDVLGGYLRRAGQDILAIGQYLDDEKNGSLRRD